MLKAVLAVLCLVALTKAAPHSTVNIFLSRIAPITPLVLTGIEDCGVAQIADVRLDGCDAAPCTINSGSSRWLTIVFSPRSSHGDRSLIYRATVTQGTTTGVLSQGYYNGRLESGQTYSLIYHLGFVEQLAGEWTLRVTISQNDVHEICFVIPLNFI